MSCLFMLHRDEQHSRRDTGLMFAYSIGMCSPREGYMGYIIRLDRDEQSPKRIQHFQMGRIFLSWQEKNTSSFTVVKTTCLQRRNLIVRLKSKTSKTDSIFLDLFLQIHDPDKCTRNESRILLWHRI